MLKVSQLWPILIKNVSHRQINFVKKSPLEDNSMNIFQTVNFQLALTSPDQHELT
jgi:hypothetical protein